MIVWLIFIIHRFNKRQFSSHGQKLTRWFKWWKDTSIVPFSIYPFDLFTQMRLERSQLCIQQWMKQISPQEVNWRYNVTWKESNFNSPFLRIHSWSVTTGIKKKLHYSSTSANNFLSLIRFLDPNLRSTATLVELTHSPRGRQSLRTLGGTLVQRMEPRSTMTLRTWITTTKTSAGSTSTWMTVSEEDNHVSLRQYIFEYNSEMNLFSESKHFAETRFRFSKTILAVTGSKSVVPCRQTSPTADVQLWQNFKVCDIHFSATLFICWRLNVEMCVF